MTPELASDESNDESSPDERSNPEQVLEDEEEGEVVAVEHAPPRLSQGIGVGAALLGVVLSVPFAVLAIPFGVAGLLITAASLLVTYSRGWLTLGTGMILVGILLTGAYGAVPPELLLVAIGATIISWDAGQHGLVIGEQVGRQSPSHRNLGVHVAATTLVIGMVSALGYLVYLIGGSGRPASAVSVAVVGVVLTAWLFRN